MLLEGKTCRGNNSGLIDHVCTGIWSGNARTKANNFFITSLTKVYIAVK